MDFDFDNKHLVELYTTGSSKKFKFLNAKAVENFLRCVESIDAANSIHDWWGLPGLNFEKLRRRGNVFSMKIDNTHRLELEIDFEDEDKTKGFVTILTVSKHYE